MLRSLHGRLLAWLLIPLLFVSIAHLYSTYIDTKKTSELIFDKLMLTLALTVSEHALATEGDLLNEELLEMIHTTTNDTLYYKVIGPDGAFIMGYDWIPEPDGGIRVLEEHIKYYDSVFLDQPVRILALSSLVNDRHLSGWMTTFIAQTRLDREAYLKAALLDASLRIAILILVTSALLVTGVSFGLRPLHRLQRSVQQRRPNDLSPIHFADVPPEIAGLVQALNELLSRLATNIAVTKRFVENAAHQLRTPVAALLPQTDLALRGAESERERVALNKIKASAEKVARLSQQLLNLTNAEAIDMSDRNLEVIDLASLVKHHVTGLGELQQAEFLKLELQPALIRGVELTIDEVLDNLLDNARKYGGEHQEILVRTYTQGTFSILEVIDRGPGIPKADHTRVMERFYRLARDTQGSGLGLAIVKEIVEAHHGTLEIDSGPKGVGTSLQCRFPGA